MDPVFLIVACLSLSQADPAAPRPFERAPIGAAIIPDEPLGEAADSAREPDAASPSGEKPLVTIDSAPVRHSQDELLQALFLPQDIGGLSGRPISLAAAVGSITAPTAREAVVQAYWRLSESAASYHVERQVWQTIEALSAGAEAEGADATIVRAALASASARIQEAKVEVNLRQRELAERMGQAADAPLPLCSDLPHTGTYTTRFEQIYRDRPATATARRIHETLPLEVEEISLRAEAVIAAGDVVEAALDQQRQRIVSSTDVVSEIDRLCQQRRAFVKAVTRYNEDIASYALPLAPASFSAERLVAMLIKPAASSSAAPVAIAEGAAKSPDGWSPVQPADYTERIDNTRTITRPPTPARAGQPTLAPPQDTNSGERPEAGGRRALESSQRQPPVANPFPTVAPLDPPEIPRSPVNVDDEHPPPNDDGPNKVEGKPADEETGEDKQVSSPQVEESIQSLHRFNHAVARAAEADEVPIETSNPVDVSSFRHYSALDRLSPGTRTRRLNELLHWAEPNADEAAPAALTLSECLKTTPPGQRLAAIEAYWAAASLRARLRMYQEFVGRFDLLQSLLLTSGNASERPMEMLQLRAMKLAVEADAVLAERELAEAQMALIDTAGKPSTGDPVMPATTPLAGRYLLRVESLPPELAGKANVKRLIDQIPAQQAALDESSAAIVLNDRAGAELTAAYLAGQRPLDDVFLAIEQQLTHTNSFLESIHNYNRSIADYALAVLPTSSTPGELAAALVHEKPREFVK